MVHSFISIDQYIKYHYQNTLFSLPGNIVYIGSERFVSNTQLLILFKMGHANFENTLIKLEKFERRFRMLVGKSEGNDMQRAIANLYCCN